jgi:hypothetical protein
VVELVLAEVWTLSVFPDDTTTVPVVAKINTAEREKTTNLSNNIFVSNFIPNVFSIVTVDELVGGETFARSQTQSGRQQKKLFI